MDGSTLNFLAGKLRGFFLFPFGSERFQGGNGRSGFLRVVSEGKLREQPHLHLRPCPWENVAWVSHLEAAWGCLARVAGTAAGLGAPCTAHSSWRSSKKQPFSPWRKWSQRGATRNLNYCS